MGRDHEPQRRRLVDADEPVVGEALGIPDSIEKALACMDAAICDAEPASSPERRRAFVGTVPDVFRFLDRLGVRSTDAKDNPDYYYPDLPCGKIGRGIEVIPFDTRRLGDWFGKSRSSEGFPAVPLKTDDVWLIARAWSTVDGFARGAVGLPNHWWVYPRQAPQRHGSAPWAASG